MRLRIPTTVLSVLLLSTSVDVYAQSTGPVIGRVLDQNGAALPGVAIDLAVNSLELTATTDDRGTYRFDAVPPGNAELTFHRLLLSVSSARRTRGRCGGHPHASGAPAISAHRYPVLVLRDFQQSRAIGRASHGCTLPIRSVPEIVPVSSQNRTFGANTSQFV